VQELAFSADLGYVNSQLQLVHEFKQICMFEDSFPLNNYLDLTACLKRLQVPGSHIYINELNDLYKSLQSIYAIISFFRTREDKTQYPELEKLAVPVSVNVAVTEAISRLLDSNGGIRDNASPELAAIRSNIRSKRSALQRILQKVLKSAISEGIVNEDTTLSIRDGRAVIPVRSSYKRKINGYLHDESATGKTAYVEPAESFETNNEISRLVQEEQVEIVRILRQFTDWLRPYLPELFDAYEFLGEIDCIRSRALLAVELEACKPQLQEEPLLQLEQARHPLLHLGFKKIGGSVVPMRLHLNAKQRMLLISGPNAGGKSVCLKTTGLIVYMVQCGFLPPVHEASVIGLFSNIFIDIGDDQSLDNDLSTYSSHLTNMRQFLEHADDTSLVLIDEFGTGTEPLLGGAIAEAVLENLNKKRTLGVITTHYTNLKHLASATEGILNGAMLFDGEKMRPLYKLRMGSAGSSFAFEIAKTIGIPAHVLKSAEEKVGKDHVDFDKNLKDLEKEKQFVFRKRQEIAEKEARLVENLDKYNAKLENINIRKKEILEDAHATANQLIAQANKKIESTIKDIVESKAEKEKTREARKQLELHKLEMRQKQKDEEDKITRKIDKIRQKQETRRNKKNVAKPKSDDNARVILSKDMPVGVGDSVIIKGQSVAGEVISVDGKNATVGFGLLKTRVSLERLDRVSRSELKKQSNSQRTSYSGFSDMSEKRLNFKTEIDLRGQRADEAMQKVYEFVEQAIVFGVKDLRILHGTGGGILRSRIREFLNTEKMVKSFKDAHPDRGGAGITEITIE